MNVNRFFRLIKFKILILILKTKLHLIRIIRNIGFVMKSLFSALSVTPFWATFIIVLAGINKANDIVYYLNEAKYSIFTSVVLVGVTSVASAINRKRKNLIDQFGLCTDLTDSANEYARELAIFLNINHKSFSPTPFSTEEEFEKMKKCFCKSRVVFSKSTYELRYQIEIVDRSLSLIASRINKNEIYSIQDEKETYSFAKMSLLRVKHSINSKKIDIEEIIMSLELLYDLIDDIRYPWRRDAEIDQKITELNISLINDEF